MSPLTFDPYHKWLGIPPHEQPPTHYRLLGLSAFERDPDVIDRAADGRMTILRTVGTGPHGRMAQALLSEVAAARVCLLNPATKRAYDATLAGPAPPPVAVQATPRRAQKPPASSHANQLFAFKVIAGGIVGLALGYAIIVGVIGIDLAGSQTTAQAPARKAPEGPRPRAVRVQAKPQPSTPAAVPEVPRQEPSVPPVKRQTAPPPEPRASRPVNKPRPKPVAKFADAPPPPPDIPLSVQAGSAPVTNRNGQLAPPPAAPGADNPPPAPPAATKPSPPPIELGPAPSANAQQLHDAFAQISNELVRILKLDTDAKKNEEHKEMIDRLNDRIKHKRFEFNFPVREVGQIRDGEAQVLLGKPVEAGIFKKTVTDAVGAIDLSAPAWTAKKITAISKGDTIRLSGKPSILTVDTFLQPGDKLIIPLIVRVEASDTAYHIYLQNFDVRHMKAPAK